LDIQQPAHHESTSLGDILWPLAASYQLRIASGLIFRWLGPATRARSIRSNAESLPIIPRRLRSPEIVRIASGGCGEVRCGLSQGLASGLAFVFLGPDP
jgi:hypothetical protein